jgi:hypothetical protein
MDFDLSLSELFAAADAIADHRSAKERYRMQRKLKRSQAALAEVIGYACEQQ